MALQSSKNKMINAGYHQSEIPISVFEFGSQAVHNYDPKYAFVIDRSRQQLGDLKASIGTVILRDSDFDSNSQSYRREKLHQRSMRIAALSIPRPSKR